jgi:hypothetical protein
MELKDYLHLYLGCEMKFDKFTGTLTQIQKHPTDDTYDWYMVSCSNWHENDFSKYKPILRPLNDMTHEELQKCGNMVYDFSDDPELNNHKWQDFEIGLASEQFHWLLSKHFDLFGLIEAGLAIDATTLLNKSQNVNATEAK